MSSKQTFFIKAGLLLKLIPRFSSYTWETNITEFDKYVEYQSPVYVDYIILKDSYIYIDNYFERKYCFELYTTQNVYYFSCVSDEQLYSWVNHLITLGSKIRISPSMSKSLYPRLDSNSLHLSAVVFQGFMQKRGSFNTAFKTRFFRIIHTPIGSCLSYSNNIFNPNHKGYIDLLFAAVIISPTMNEDDDKDFCIRTTEISGVGSSTKITNPRTFYLRAGSNEQRDNWIRQNIFHAARLEHQRNTITNQRNFCATDMPMTNQYQFLGLYPWATDVDINKVYDKYIATVKPNKSDAREIYKFTQMKTAKSMLLDPFLRADFDSNYCIEISKTRNYDFKWMIEPEIKVDVIKDIPDNTITRKNTTDLKSSPGKKETITEISLPAILEPKESDTVFSEKSNDLESKGDKEKVQNKDGSNDSFFNSFASIVSSSFVTSEVPVAVPGSKKPIKKGLLISTVNNQGSSLVDDSLVSVDSNGLTKSVPRHKRNESTEAIVLPGLGMAMGVKTDEADYFSKADDKEKKPNFNQFEQDLNYLMNGSSLMKIPRWGSPKAIKCWIEFAPNNPHADANIMATLYHFRWESHKKSDEESRVHLHQAQLITIKSSNPNEYHFSFTLPNRTLELFTTSREDYTRWIAVLNRIMLKE